MRARWILFVCLVPRLAVGDGRSPGDPWIKAERQVLEVKSTYIPVESADQISGVEANKAANYVAMLVIAGAAVLKQKQQLEEARGTKLTAREDAEFVAGVAAQLLTGGQSIASFTAMNRAARLTSPLVHALGPKAADPATLALLRSTLAHSIGSVVAMGAGATFAELWQKAVERLPEEDQGRALNLISSLSAAYQKPSGIAGAVELAKQYIVFQKILANMGEIAIVDPKARDMWMYDTWRNRIATGKFVSGAAMVSLGATAGGSLGSAVPFIGTAVGTIAGGGLGAAADTFLVSDAKKAALTDSFINMRRGVLVNRLNSCMDRLEGIYRLSESASFNRDHHVTTTDLTRPLDQCAKFREGVMTIYLDQARNLFSQIMVAQNRTAEAHREGRSAEEKKWKNTLLEAALKMDHLRGDIGEFYDAQKNRFDRFRSRLRNTTSTDLLEQEASRCQKMHDIVRVTLANVADDQQSAIRMFEASNEGFSEKGWLDYEDSPPPLAPRPPGSTDNLAPPVVSPYGASPSSSQQ